VEQAYNNPIRNIGDKAYSWKPGQSGNPAGRPPNSVTTLLKNTNALTNEQIAQVIIQKVLSGDFQFVKEYLDRTDGKVLQEHEFKGQLLIANPDDLEEARRRLFATTGPIRAIEEGNDALS